MLGSVIFTLLCSTREEAATFNPALKINSLKLCSLDSEKCQDRCDRV